MRRIGLLVLWIMMMGTLISCEGQQEELLSYQDRDGVYRGICRMEDGEYTLRIRIYADGRRELEFLAPESLVGCGYRRSTGGEYLFFAGEALYPVSENPTVAAIFSLFALSPGDLISASAESHSGVGINRLTFPDGISVYLSSATGSPLRFEHPLLSLTLYEESGQGLCPWNPPEAPPLDSARFLERKRGKEL